jgi:diguanylate cyclase (GGDEF)-like protein
MEWLNTSKGLLDENTLRWMATHDSLTGLPNRLQFMEQKHELVKSLSGDQKCAVFIVDLDKFKPVNDQYGHRVGDEVLKAVAKRLNESVDDGVVARIGGDEFGILCAFSKEDALEQIAARILHRLQQPINVAHLHITIGASIGSTVFPTGGNEDNPFSFRDGSAAEATFRRADMALHAAKTSGRGRHCRFQQEMEEELLLRVQLEGEIAGAIQDRQVVPFYQPIVDMRWGRVLGFEVLAQWMHPEKGLIYPDVLIPVAESTGSIGTMMHQLLRQALRDAHTWPDDIFVSINLSPIQFQDAWVAGNILAIAREASFPLRRIQVEITENALAANADSARYIVDFLQRFGVRVALDDFGAGYAGVRYLRQFKFDSLKIDKSLVTDLASNPEDMRIVKAIVAFSQALDIETVPEGVETAAIRELLLELGCVTGQGYLFGQPQAAAQVQSYFRSEAAPLRA